MIFDCDGVLVDSERLAVRVEARALTELGWVISEAEVVERFLGRSLEFMLGEIEAHLGRPLGDGWKDDLQRLYRHAFQAELAPVDGIVEALDQITIATCVASSGSQETIRYTLDLTGLYDRFAGRIFSASEVKNGKPAPDLFLYAAERMRADPSTCAVVEDSRSGVEAARAARMVAFGYAGGLIPAKLLAGPDTVIFENMRELPRLIREV